MRQSPDIAPDEEWRDRLSLRFMQVRLHNPDPDEWFDEWAAAAVDYFNDSHMFFAYKLWHEVSHYSSLELHFHIDEVERLRHVPHEEDDIPF